MLNFIIKHTCHFVCVFTLIMGIVVGVHYENYHSTQIRSELFLILNKKSQIVEEQKQMIDNRNKTIQKSLFLLRKAAEELEKKNKEIQELKGEYIANE